MDKFNVCLINDSFPPLIDGVANAVTNYGHIINKDLGRAAVVTPYYPDAHDSDFDFPVIRFPSINTTPLVGYRAGVPFAAETIGELKKCGFDIIHSHCPITSSMLGRVLRNEIDKPLVFTYHTKFDIDIQNSVCGVLLQDSALRLIVDNVSASDEVWVVSDGAGKNLQSLGYEGDYIVMPNGVDLPKERVSDDVIHNTCDGYDIPANIPVYLFVGRMIWYKGIRIILDALKALKAEGKDFRMVFIGGGDDKAEMIKYASENGIFDKTIFCEPIHDRTQLRAWYCRADLFLFPSTFDTNGLVVREAAACGLASVLVKGSCAAEDTKADVNAFWIEEDAGSLYALLSKIWANFGETRRIGEFAQRDLYISWDDAVKRAFDRYQIVSDRYRSADKKLRRRTVSDQFFRASTDAIDNLLHIQQLRQHIKDQARSILDELDRYR